MRTKSMHKNRARISALIAAAAIAVVGLTGIAEAQTPPPALTALVPAAKTEGKINLSWGATVLGGADGVRRFEAGFNKYYGMQARFNFTPGPAFQAALLKMWQEKNANQKAFMDVAIGADTQVYWLQQNDLLVPMDWAPLLPFLSRQTLDAMTAPDGSLISFVSRLTALSYNTRAIAAADAPKTMMDLLNPKWKGKIATTPYAAGFQILATDPRWGVEKTFDFARKLAPNLAGFMRCGEGDRLTSGEFLIFAIECEPELIERLRERGAPVGTDARRARGVVSEPGERPASASRQPHGAKVRG
jgi:iron(III) transport system substrate-binding protein